MGPESKLEKDLRKFALSRGADYVKLTIRKYPDRMVLGSLGRVLFMELKKPKGAYQPGQKEKLEELRGRGLLAFRVESFAHGAFLIDLITDPQLGESKNEHSKA